VAADEDTVPDVVHGFNQKGLAALDPGWAGGRPRRISDHDIEVIVTAASTAMGERHTGSSMRIRLRAQSG
jgi:transposase